MAEIAIFRINYKSDFILTLKSDAGWMTPFCIKFWTGAPSQAYFAGYDGTTYTHCAPVEGEPTKLSVQFDDHHLPIGDLKFQIGYHFTVADFPTSIEDEVINQAAVIIDNDGEQQQVMLDFNGETAPEIEFSLPAYANEAQRIANEEQRIAHEATRIVNEESRIAAETIRQQNEQQRISNEEARVREFARLKTESEAATAAATTAAGTADTSARNADEKAAAAQAAATLANDKAQLAADKAALAQAAAALANDKAQLAADKAALAQAAAALANDKAALAQQKADYAQTQGDYAKEQGDYAKAQAGVIPVDVTRTQTDATFINGDNEPLFHLRQANSSLAGLMTAAGYTKLNDMPSAQETNAGIAYDVSVLHPTSGVNGGSTYASLSDALAVIPQDKRKGGMTVKFVLSSDNKYVQYMLMADTFTTTESAWQKQGAEVSVSQNIKTTLQEGTNVQIGGTNQNIGDYTTQCRINADYSNILKIEHNTISIGQNVNGYPARARTSGYISAPFSINVANGYVINNVFVYSKDKNGTISYVGSVAAGASFYSSEVNDNLYRISFKKTDDSVFSDADLTQIVSFFVGVIYESSRKALFANFVNVNTLNNVTTGYSLSDAVAAVPAMYRRVGCIITFRKTDLSKWEHYQFNVGQTTDTYWLNTASWENITPEIPTIPTISDNDRLGDVTLGVSSNREYLNVALIENNNRFLTIESGTISSGQNVNDYPARARTKYYIQAPFYLKLKEGFYVNSVFRYTLNANGGIAYVDSPTTYSPAEYYTTDKSYIYRVVLKKGMAGTSSFTQDDLNSCIDTFRGLNEPNIEQSKWVACGDSITEGYYSKVGNPPYARDATVGWVHKVERITRKVVNNLGIGGTGWAHGDSNCARQKIDTWISGGEFNGASLVTFAYGVNDWKYNETLGTMDDAVSSSATNIIPSMRYVIERLMATYPALKIVVISPINCSAYGTKANNWGIGYPFSNNGTLEQVYQALKTVCEYYGIEYIDMLHSSVVNKENIQALLLDGVHPTPECHTMMARELAMKINCY